MKKYQVVQEETFNPIADVFDTYEEAIAQIEEYEKEDKEDGNFVEGYYSVIEVEYPNINRLREELENICYDEEIFYIDRKYKKFFKPYDLPDYKGFRKTKIHGFILYHRTDLPNRLIKIIEMI